LGRGFVSANLPLEHKRALDEIGHSEFRPGIARDSQQVDLSGEFERQFYGDVMLFTLEQLCQQGYPAKFVPEAVVEGLLTHIEASMQDKYLTKQTQIKARLKVLAALFEQPEYWWNRDSKYHNARASLRRFIRNMEYNFSLDSPGYRMIRDASHRRQRHQQLLAAIMQLPQARSSWLDALANQQ
jgi:hypothetical protein